MRKKRPKCPHGHYGHLFLTPFRLNKTLQPDKIMNTNQKFPGNGSPVPVLVIIGLGFALVNWLLSDDDTEKKPETAPADAIAERRRKEAETPAFRPSPAEIPAKPAIVPIHSAPAPVFPSAVIPPFSV